MGDRTSVSITIKKSDESKFIELLNQYYHPSRFEKFSDYFDEMQDDFTGHSVTGVRIQMDNWMQDELQEWAKKIDFIGFHEGGESYGPGRFAAFNGAFTEVQADHSGRVCIPMYRAGRQLDPYTDTLAKIYFNFVDLFYGVVPPSPAPPKYWLDECPWCHTPAGMDHKGECKLIDTTRNCHEDNNNEIVIPDGAHVEKVSDGYRVEASVHISNALLEEEKEKKHKIQCPECGNPGMNVRCRPSVKADFDGDGQVVDHEFDQGPGSYEDDDTARCLECSFQGHPSDFETGI